MTILEAVNEILAGIGDPPVTALGSAGTTEKEAQDRLDVERKHILKRGWAVNTDEDITLDVPTISITLAAGVVSGGPFKYNEVITETTSGATGYFDSIHEQTIYIRTKTGTFTGDPSSGLRLTGGTSGATVDGRTYAAVTTAPIGVALEDEWFMVSPHTNRGRTVQWPPFVPRPSDRTTSDPTNGDYLILYDTNDNVYTFGSSVRIDRHINIAFADLTRSLQDYIVKIAAMKFNRQKKGSGKDDSFLQQEAVLSRVSALREDNNLSRSNVLQSHDARAVLGQRHSVSFGVG